MPLLRSRPAQRVAIAASYVPFLRQASYPIVGLELMRRHVYRGASAPPELLAGIAGMNKAMYSAMWGPSEFFATGPLATWDVASRLGEIDVPALVTSGAHEFASPDQMRMLVDALPDAEWALFDDSAHCAEFEEPERYADVLTSFLAKVEAGYLT
jgi:pimeloyl-ACP methyl ester carboxylesterase